MPSNQLSLTRDLPILTALERKVLWLATWTIHNANHLRENNDGVKVGGHQASSASMVSILSVSSSEATSTNRSPAKALASASRRSASCG